MDSDFDDVIPFVSRGQKVSPELLDRVVRPTISDRGRPSTSKPSREVFQKKTEMPRKHRVDECTKEVAGAEGTLYDVDQEIAAAFVEIEQILRKLPATAHPSSRFLVSKSVRAAPHGLSTSTGFR